MVSLVRKLGASLLAVLFFGSAVAMAAGQVTDEDFVCQGVMLGDNESVLHRKWGEPLYDKISLRQGVKIKTFVYKNGYEASISPRMGQVVDFMVNMDKYEGRQGVRQGATKFWLEKIYGKKQRQHIDGLSFLVFDRPGHPHQHLLLQVDPEDGHLLEVKITALPLDEAEADVMAAEGNPLLAENELEDNGLMTIDTSALPQDKGVHLEGLGR